MPSDNKKIKMSLSVVEDDNNSDNDDFHGEASHGNYNNDYGIDNPEEEAPGNEEAAVDEEEEAAAVDDEEEEAFDNYARQSEITKSNDRNNKEEAPGNEEAAVDEEEEAAAVDDEEEEAFGNYARRSEITKSNDRNNERSESEKLFIEKYEILEKIGQGTYGKVYRGRERRTGKYVAIKKSNIENPREEGIPACTLREISNLKILNRCDEHIVKLLGVECVEKKRALGGWVVYLVFEYMDCDLVQVYREHQCLGQPISPFTIKSYMYQLLKGVEHCHRNGILHRDLKPGNLLVNENTGLLKVADWGLGRLIVGTKGCFSNIHGTLFYTAPEQLLGDPQQTFALDMWAVGCIFGEMHSLKPVFEANSEIEVLLKIFKILGTPNESAWAGLSKLENWSDKFPQWRRPDNLRESFGNLDDLGFDLLVKMFEYQPSKRICAKHALSHPYFAEYSDSYESHSAESESSESES